MEIKANTSRSSGLAAGGAAATRVASELLPLSIDSYADLQQKAFLMLKQTITSDLQRPTDAPVRYALRVK